jgi:hypothetical protein
VLDALALPAGVSVLVRSATESTVAREYTTGK